MISSSPLDDGIKITQYRTLTTPRNEISGRNAIWNKWVMKELEECLNGTKLYNLMRKHSMSEGFETGGPKSGIGGQSTTVLPRLPKPISRIKRGEIGNKTDIRPSN